MKITTSTGFEVEVLSIPMVMDAYMSGRQNIEPPTYEVKTFGGPPQHFPLTETIVASGDISPEEKEAWDSYIIRKSISDRAHNDNFIRLLLLKGIRVEGEITEEWKHETRLCGIPIPDDPIDLKLQWIKVAVCPAATDLENIMTTFMRVNGMPEEMIRQAEDTFQRAMERNSDSGTSNTGKQMDGVGSVRTGSRRVRTGKVHERVRRSKR